MKPRKHARWKRILGAMALNLGRLYRDIYGSSAGVAEMSLPVTPRSHRNAQRHSRRKKAR